MVELSVSRTELLTPLLLVSGAIDKRQSLIILSHILFTLSDNSLVVTATDLEIEISAKIPCQSQTTPSQFTVPAKKFIDIIRSLDETTVPSIKYQDASILVKANRSNFKLSTLSNEQFPRNNDDKTDIEFSLPKADLFRLLQSTAFAMSPQQDVRVFLNGLLFEISPSCLTSVAMDGHRMAVFKWKHDSGIPLQRLLLPRKGVQEMLRLLSSVADETVQISAGKSHFRLMTETYTFTSKLLEAQFPPYHLVIPKDNDKYVTLEKEALKKALSRIMILANEKVKAVQVHVEMGCLTLTAKNEEHDEATEVVEATVEGDPLSIGVNAAYLLEVLSYIPQSHIRLSLSTGDKSILVEPAHEDGFQYIIMPMKL